MQETRTAASSTVEQNHGELRRESDRAIFIYTGYAISALALLGAVVYHFSTQVIP